MRVAGWLALIGMLLLYGCAAAEQRLPDNEKTAASMAG